MPEPLRVVFAGTPDFAAQALQALLQADCCQLVAVYSQPDRPRGRGKKLSPSPVKALALEHQLPVYQPLNFKHADSVAQLVNLSADVMVVAAYGLLLPASVLNVPRLGCINIHASLLPRWRGAAPVERAIEQGDSETGVTIMQMDEGLDTGDMLLKRRLTLADTDTGDSVREGLAKLGGAAIIEALQHSVEAPMQGEAQDATLATYAAKIHKQECLIDWTLPAERIAQKIRAFYSGYTSHSFLNGERIKFGSASADNNSTNSSANCSAGEIVSAGKEGLRVATGEGLVNIHQLQYPGGRMLSAGDLLNSRADKFLPGFQFSDQ